MRCLTLATDLREKGAEVSFACRAHPMNLIKIVRERKFSVHELPLNQGYDQNKFIQKNRSNVEDYVDWLGCSQKEDVQLYLEKLGINVMIESLRVRRVLRESAGQSRRI